MLHLNVLATECLGLRCWSKVWVQVNKCVARHAQSLWVAEALRWSQPGSFGWLEGRGVVDSLSTCHAAVWEAAKRGAHGVAKKKRRVVVEQPRAQSARKQLEQQVALEASDACCLLQASVEAAQETSSVAGTCHVGYGNDVATLLSLLAAALRKGQQQCHLPCSVRNQDLKSLLATLGQLRACFLGPQVPATPRAQRNLRQHRTRPRQPSQLPFPGVQARQRATWSPGASSSGAANSAHDPVGHHVVEQPVGATPVAGGGAEGQTWPQGVQFVS